MEYLVKLPVFEGPFALLFHLIEKAEVDIYEISLAEITAEYLETIQAMQELNLEVASEFLVMAATLLKLKSKKLLPTVTGPQESEEDEDFLSITSQEELVERLVEYRYFRQVAQEMRNLEQAQKRVFVRTLSGERAMLVNPEDSGDASGATLQALVRAFARLIAEQERRPHELEAEEFSVRAKMRQVLQLLRKFRDGVDFRSLFGARPSLSEIIATFFALLELVRLRKIRVSQAEPHGNLMITRR